jgi:RNA polymerase sigma factor (sigma-70 family)
MLEYVDDASSYLVGDESLRYADTINDIQQHDNVDERFELRQKLTIATKKLSQTQQDILYYRFVEDMSLQAIAHTLSLKCSSVKMNYYRALEKLNKLYTH